MYLAGADIVEYGASNAELSDEELKALEGSVELLKSAKANFGPIALEILKLSEEDEVVQAVGDAYEDEAAEIVLYNVISTMVYFDIVFDVYDLGFSFSDLFANFAY